jgi:hypothetical protein
MATGSAWNVDNPLKPWALFDADAVRDIPFEWDLWLADIGSTHSNHSATAQAGLEVVTTSEADGVILVRVRKDPEADLIAGQKYWVTCHMEAADGQEDDQTVYLKIAEK